MPLGAILTSSTTATTNYDEIALVAFKAKISGHSGVDSWNQSTSYCS
jgi:hypothetical protein